MEEAFTYLRVLVPHNNTESKKKSKPKKLTEADFDFLLEVN